MEISTPPETPTPISASVIIRHVQPTDGQTFTAAGRRSTSLHHPWITCPQDSAAFEQYLRRFDGQTNFGFVVCQAGTGEIVGAINVTNVVRGLFQSGYLGYFAFSGYEGQGLMTQGLKAVVRYAFGELELHRMEANIQPENAASIALVRRCGFHREGYSPAYLKIADRWRDHERWAIVRDYTHSV